jgi:ATP-dependent Clp protease adaptor protein ClpS
MTSKETKKKSTGNSKKIPDKEYWLVLYNDDVNSFDYVAEALMEICEHSYEQAMQCTLIAHNNGSCDIRRGQFKELKKMKDALNKKNLSTSISPLP